MKVLNKKQKNYRKLIISLSLIAALVLGYSLFAYSTNIWPFSSTAPETTEERPAGDGVDTSDQTDQATRDDQDVNEPNSSTENPSSSDQPSYIRPDISNPPSDNASYPIETERYRIDRNSNGSFSVELYPIVNNPEYSNYDKQLRDYKDEVLAYLESRYGDTNNLNITWLPEDAQNI